MGGLFFDFEPFRTTSVPLRRVRESVVAATASSRDHAAATPSMRPEERVSRPYEPRRYYFCHRLDR